MFTIDIESFCRRIVDDPGAIPPELWQFFLQSNITPLAEKCRFLAAQTVTSAF